MWLRLMPDLFHLYVIYVLKQKVLHQMQWQPCSEYINNLNIIRDTPLNTLHRRATASIHTTCRPAITTHTYSTLPKGFVEHFLTLFLPWVRNVWWPVAVEHGMPLSSVGRNLCCCYFRPPEGIVQKQRLLRLFCLVILIICDWKINLQD